MTFNIPAHKVVGDVGKPGQVRFPDTYNPASVWPFPTKTDTLWADTRTAANKLRAHLPLDINLDKLEEEAADARRLRMMYDNLFYNPVDVGV